MVGQARGTVGALVDVWEATVARHGAILLPPTTVSIAPGECVALRGANGTGKTTLLRLMAGQLDPDSGRVRIAGRPPRRRDPGFRALLTGMIGTPPFARDMTLLEQATLVGLTWGSAAAASRRAALSLLASLGLAELATRFPHELSSGQAQLAGLALALSRPAGLVLLDEPEQRLDDERLARVAAVLRSRRDAGATVVAATHSGRLVSELDARVVWLGAA